MKLSISWFRYVPVLSYDLEQGIITAPGARVRGLGLGFRGVLFLLHMERSQLRWFRHLTRMPLNAFWERYFKHV